MSDPAASNPEQQSSRQRRVNVKMNVRISTIDAETDPWTGKPYFRTSNETCANVSRGGAFVLTSEPIGAGRRLLLELDIPGGPTVQAIGRVAWSKLSLAPAGKPDDAGIGVEFVGGSPEQLRALDDFLSRATRRSSRDSRQLGTSHARKTT